MSNSTLLGYAAISTAAAPGLPVPMHEHLGGGGGAGRVPHAK